MIKLAVGSIFFRMYLFPALQGLVLSVSFPISLPPLHPLGFLLFKDIFSHMYLRF